MTPEETPVTDHTTDQSPDLIALTGPEQSVITCTDTVLVPHTLHLAHDDVRDALFGWLRQHGLDENVIVTRSPITRHPDARQVTWHGTHRVGRHVHVTEAPTAVAADVVWPAPFPDVLLAQPAPDRCVTCGGDYNRVLLAEVDRLELALNHAEAEAERLSAALAPYVAEDRRQAEWAAACAKGDVRCVRCNLRWEERQEYGCQEPGRGHSFDEDDLEEAGRVDYPPNPLDEPADVEIVAEEVVVCRRCAASDEAARKRGPE